MTTTGTSYSHWNSVGGTTSGTDVEYSDWLPRKKRRRRLVFALGWRWRWAHLEKQRTLSCSIRGATSRRADPDLYPTICRQSEAILRKNSYWAGMKASHINYHSMLWTRKVTSIANRIRVNVLQWHTGPMIKDWRLGPDWNNSLHGYEILASPVVVHWPLSNGGLASIARVFHGRLRQCDKIEPAWSDSLSKQSVVWQKQLTLHHFRSKEDALTRRNSGDCKTQSSLRDPPSDTSRACRTERSILPKML